MTRAIPALAGVAALQLALVTYTWWPRKTTEHAARDLVDLPAEIDRIVIDGRVEPGSTEPPTHLELKRDGDRWVLPELFGYPVDPEKVTELLDRIDDLSVRAPVAERATSHASLNIADDDHARTLTLFAGDAEVKLLLGAASGKAVHIRRAGEPAVYAVRGWNAWAIPDQISHIWDSKLIDVEPDAVDSLTLTCGDQGFTLEKQNDTWTAAGQDVLIDDDVVHAMLTRLSSTHMTEVVGTTRTPDLDTGTRVEWTSQVGDAVARGALSIGASDGANTTVQVDGSTFVVRVQASSVRRWTELTLEDLIFIDDLEGIE